MTNGLIEITHDLYDIASRIRETDECCRVFFNAKLRRYEVHGERGLQSILPYASLDARAVSYVLETRAERIKDLMKEIERQNAAIERAENKKSAEKFAEKAERVLTEATV